MKRKRNQASDERVEHLRETVMTLREKGIRYERMACEAGFSVDSIRRWVYGTTVPSELSVRKFMKWANHFGKRLDPPRRERP